MVSTVATSFNRTARRLLLTNALGMASAVASAAAEEELVPFAPPLPPIGWGLPVNFASSASNLARSSCDEDGATGDSPDDDGKAGAAGLEFAVGTAGVDAEASDEGDVDSAGTAQDASFGGAVG